MVMIIIFVRLLIVNLFIFVKITTYAYAYSYTLEKYYMERNFKIQFFSFYNYSLFWRKPSKKRVTP